MANPLRGPDAPNDPFVDQLTMVRAPARQLSQPTIDSTVLDDIEAASIYRNAALSVNNNDIITWDTIITDSIGLWNGSTGIVIPIAGKITGPWRFHAQVTYPGTGAGTLRGIQLLQNGVAIATKTHPANALSVSLSRMVISPQPGDVFTVKITQDSGGPLALTVGSANMWFEVFHAQ